MATDFNLLGNGAAYVRVSTDVQDEARQHSAIKRWCERHGVTIPAARIYVDKGWRRWEASVRPSFNRMLADIDNHKIQWVVIDRQDRAESADPYETFATLHRLRKSECRLLTVDDADLTSNELAPTLTTLLQSQKSASESMERAVRVVEAMVERVKRGQWLGGHVPYGLDVACVDATGRELWRVVLEGRDKRVKLDATGTHTRYDGEKNWPQKDAGHVLQLRPSKDPRTLKIVRDIFSWFSTESITPHQIAKRLNAAGIKRYYEPKWQARHISQMLANPCYIGRPVWNRFGQGRYVEFIDGQRRPVTNRNWKDRIRERSQWVLSEHLLYQPLVNSKTWELVQSKLNGVKARIISRSPRSPKIWLSGLLVCAGCGKPMRGHVPANTGRPGYICSTYAEHANYQRAGESTCGRNFVEQSTVEQYLTKYLDDCGRGLILGDPEKSGQIPLSSELAVYGRKMLQHARQVRERLGLPDSALIDLEEQCKRFAEVLTKESPAFTKQLAQVEAEHDQLLSSILRLPDSATRAIDKAKKRLMELEEQITRLENALHDHAADIVENMVHMVDILKAHQEACEAVRGEQNYRVRAERVRCVISRIVLRYEPTGSRHPTTRLAEVRFEPVDVGSMKPDITLGWPDTSENSASSPGWPGPTAAC